MALKKTSLSAGAVIRDILLANKEVKRRTNSVFPIVIDKAQLPYILYRRAALLHNPTKAGAPGADTVSMEVVCYTAQYAEGVELAEAVRAALDYAHGEREGVIMRSCTLVDSEEGYEDDAYVQQLVFQVKI
ncbi:tail completion protein gp17 [Prevotella sp.]|uniref:tail completion protein gp17 n=1 Tax=Prevotella sp. TaxID=59823 RepID=UPI003080E5F3